MNIFTKRKRTELKNEIVKERSDSMKKEKNLTPTLYVVVPCYNEEAVLEETTKQLKVKMEGLIEKKIISNKSKVMYVNDGSKDNTQLILEEIAKEDKNVKILSFSRNFGHQAAVTAGIKYVTGDAIVIMDADLQDPPELIPDMLKLWEDGNEVIYGKRKARKGESLFK